MFHVAIVIFCGLLPLAGAGAILWFLIHFWVAFRMEAKLKSSDYALLAIGVLAVVGGIAGLNYAARHAPPLSTPIHPDQAPTHPAAP